MTGYPESNPYSSVEKKPKRKKTVIIIAAGALAAALIAAAIIIIVNINKADQTAKIDSQSFSNLNLYTSNGRFYADEDNYYFTNGKKIFCRQKEDGASANQIYSSENTLSIISTSGSKLFFFEKTENSLEKRLRSVNKDGSNLNTHYTVSSENAKRAVVSKNLLLYADKENIHIIDFTTGKQIKTISLPEEMRKNLSSLYFRSVDDNMLYYEKTYGRETETLTFPTTVCSMDLDTKECKKLFEANIRNKVIIANHRCYYLNRNSLCCYDIKTDTAYTLDSSMKSISHSDFSDGQRIDFCAEGDTVYFYNPDIGELYSIKYDGSGKTQLNPSGKFFWYECVSGNELFGSSDDEPALFNIETGSVIKLSENK